MLYTAVPLVTTTSGQVRNVQDEGEGHFQDLMEMHNF